MRNFCQSLEEFPSGIRRRHLHCPPRNVTIWPNKCSSRLLEPKPLSEGTFTTICWLHIPVGADMDELTSTIYIQHVGSPAYGLLPRFILRYNHPPMAQT